MSMEEWLESSEYADAFKRLMALALLHDVLVWGQAPLDLRAPIYDVLNSFGVNEAKFHGYWGSLIKAEGCDCMVSHYLNKSEDEALLIVVNLGGKATDIRIRGHLEEFSQQESLSAIDVTNSRFLTRISDNEYRTSLGRKDFFLVRMILSNR